MYIDIQKFKNGQLYSRPEWNTDTKKESILCEVSKTYLLVAEFENNVWTVKRGEALILGDMFLHSDYFEVNDPLHFSHEKQESMLKEAIEKMKGLTPTPSLENLMYTNYGTGNPQVIQPPVTSTAYMGYFTGSDKWNLLDKVPEKDCVVSVTEMMKPLQTINEYIQHKGIDRIQNKKFMEELVKLSQYYKDVKIEDDSI